MRTFLNYKAEIKERESINEEFHNSENEEFQENEITEIPPQLYSKRVITAFSLLFSTIFGAAILMSNLKKKGENKGCIQVLIFSIIYTVGTIITINSVSSSTFTLPLNILGAILLNEYFWNRYLGKNIEFEKKSWIKPGLISIAVIIPFILVVLYA